MSRSMIVRDEIGRLELPTILQGAPMHKPKKPEQVFIQHLALPDRGIVCGAARVDVGEGRWAPRAGLTWTPLDALPEVTCWNCRSAVDA